MITNSMITEKRPMCILNMMTYSNQICPNGANYNASTNLFYCN